MVCRGNWICFECRIAARRDTWRGVTACTPETIGMTGNVKCRHCNQHAFFIGPSIKVPPKAKIKEWQKLFNQIFSFRQAYQENLHKQRVFAKHVLEKEILKLKSRPTNYQRNRLISKYEKEL